MESKIKLKRIAGGYTVICSGHTYMIHQFRSDYGDLQWMVDRDDHSSVEQFNTLGDCRDYLASLA